MKQSRANRKKMNQAKVDNMRQPKPDGKLANNPLSPYLEGKMVNYYGDKRYTGEYPDVHVQFSMDAKRKGDIIVIEGHDLKSFRVKLAKDEIKEWIDSRQEMARQTLAQARKLEFGPEEPYFYTKKGQFVYDSAIRWDLGKDRYVVLRPSTSDGWLLESCANIESYVADVFYDSDVTHREFRVSYPHKHGVERTEIKGKIYIDITDPYGNGARMLRDTERFIQDYNILPERLDKLNVGDVRAKYPDLLGDKPALAGRSIYDLTTRDHYFNVTVPKDLKVDVCVSLTGGQDMLQHAINLDHIKTYNEHHLSSLNHLLKPMGLNCTFEDKKCLIRGSIPSTVQERQDLLDTLQKGRDLVLDYDQTSGQTATKLNMDDLVILTDQSMYFQ